MSKVIKVSDTTHSILKQLSEEQYRSIDKVIAALLGADNADTRIDLRVEALESRMDRFEQMAGIT